MAAKINLRNWLIQKIRRASYMWPPRKAAATKARISRGLYRCASCEGEFKRGEIQLDHITPVIDPEMGFQTWDIFIERLFCEEEGYQVLCRPCHSSKSFFENQIRSQIRHEKEGFKLDMSEEKKKK